VALGMLEFGLRLGAGAPKRRHDYQREYLATLQALPIIPVAGAGVSNEIT